MNSQQCKMKAETTPLLAALSVLRDRVNTGSCNLDAAINLLASERLVRLSSVTAGRDVTIRFEPSDARLNLLAEPMNFKVAFVSGAWTIIQADCYTLDERLLVFVKDGHPVLTAILANVLFFEPTTETESPPKLG
jgi:hypothetical protein